VAEDAEIFVGDTEGNNEEEGKEKRSVRGDVPAPEDDTSVDDVGIPMVTPFVRYKWLNADY